MDLVLDRLIGFVSRLHVWFERRRGVRDKIMQRSWSQQLKLELTLSEMGKLQDCWDEENMGVAERIF